jgi:hypothetical protein
MPPFVSEPDNLPVAKPDYSEAKIVLAMVGLTFSCVISNSLRLAL